MLFLALHRFQNYYGETYARLCLDEQRLGLRSDKMGNFLKLGYAILFNMPESIHDDLKLLFNDNMLYAKHWVTFAGKIREMWKTTCLQVSHIVLIQSLNADNAIVVCLPCYVSRTVTNCYKLLIV